MEKILLMNCMNMFFYRLSVGSVGSNKAIRLCDAIKGAIEAVKELDKLKEYGSVDDIIEKLNNLDKRRS